MRQRMQWCMTPLGMNMLPADAVDYAKLELYLTSFDVGKPLSVPGIRHAGCALCLDLCRQSAARRREGEGVSDTAVTVTFRERSVRR